MARLLTIRGTNTGVSYDLGERTRIGRLGENEVQVPDPNVSRIHAEIVQDADTFSIFDRGSKNGVLVNGQEVADKVLAPGDEIIIGNASFIFEPHFEIENARFSDNSVYVVPGTTDDTFTLDADSVAASVESVCTSIIGPDPASLPELTFRIAEGVREHFSAQTTIVFLKDNTESGFHPVEVSPAGNAVLVSKQLIARMAKEGAAIAGKVNLEVPAGFMITGDKVPTPEPGVEDTGRRNQPAAVTRDNSGRATHRDQCIMCAPMKSGTEVTGFISVIACPGQSCTKEQLKALQDLANLAHHAIQATRQRAANLNRPVPSLDPESRSVSTRSLRMQEIYNSARRSADSQGTILITGESGTGKETLARFIHENSPRANAPFVIVNCSSIPPELFETEMFGYEKGAFDGADVTRLGKVEEAQGGTLYMTNIGDLDLALQPKLLRFLQDRAFYRQGGHRAIGSDIRIIAASTADLAAAVRAGKFREDLWYRLNVVPFHMPPLRERREDIGPLVDFFINVHSNRLNKKVLGANDGAIALLQKYDWPANLRELENAVERGVMLAESRVLATSDFSHIEEARRRLNSQADLERKRDTKPLAEVERQHILIALKKHNFNQARAAEALGLHRNTLRNKIIEYGIEITK